MSENYGGARPGAGTKPANFVKSDALKAYDAARARRRAIEADRQELAHSIDLTKYVSRSAFIQATETVIAGFAASMSHLPGVEGADSRTTAEVQRMANEAIAALAVDLRKIARGI